MRHGSFGTRWRIWRKLVRAGPLTRILCAREVAAAFAEQLEACTLPARPGNTDPPAGGLDSAVARHAIEITRTTGIAPRDQMARFTPREWAALLAHVSWVQMRDNSAAVANAGTAKVIPDYPDLDRPAGGEADDDRIRHVMASWTVH